MPAFGGLSGYTREEVLGQTIPAFSRAADGTFRALRRSPRDRVTSGGSFFWAIQSTKRKDGTIFEEEGSELHPCGIDPGAERQLRPIKPRT